MEYEEFEIGINPDGAGGFQLRAVSEPDKPTEPFEPPLSFLELDALYSSLQTEIGRIRSSEADANR